MCKNLVFGFALDKDAGDRGPPLADIRAGSSFFRKDRFGVMIDTTSLDIDGHLPCEFSQNRFGIFLGDFSKRHDDARTEIGQPLDDMKEPMDGAPAANLARSFKALHEDGAPQLMRNMTSEHDAGFVDRAGVVVFGIPDKVPHRLNRRAFLLFMSTEPGQVLKEIENAPLGRSSMGMLPIIQDSNECWSEDSLARVGVDDRMRIVCNVSILAVEEFDELGRT